MQTILITGSNGQLGNELKILSSSFPKINFIFHDIDTLNITDHTAVSEFFSSHRPNIVVNCAAYTAVDKAENETNLAYLINEKAVAYLLEACEKYNAKIIQLSTDYVFDGKKYLPYIETDATNPMSVYGKSKLAGEKHLEDNKNAIVIRTSWLYSSFGNNFVKTIIRLSSERNELKVVFDQIGTPTYAKDLARTILSIIEQIVLEGNSFIPGIYHFSNEGICSWYDLAKEIVQFRNSTCKVFPIVTSEFPTLAVRPSYSVLDKSKIKKTYSIQIPWWKDSLIDCLKKIAQESK
jgi:dTDP-4-dehydrorhamnose reductase